MRLTFDASFYQETELWVNVRKKDGKWLIGGVKELSYFESDWDEEEPSDGLSKDCAFLSKNSG